MPNPLTEERRNYITQQLLMNRTIKARELADKFGVSTETIRRDLLRLEETGLAKKGYGGAVIANELMEAGFVEKAVLHPMEKTAIAAKAAEFVEDGAVIFLDSGSTVFELAKHLVLKKDIVVFTNSLQAAQFLSDTKVRTHLVGGEVKTTSKAVVGGWALRQLAEIRASVAFLGTSGFKGRDGPCIESLRESEVKQAMLRNAYRAVVVADSSKAGIDAMIQYARWDDVHALVTDRNLHETVLASLLDKTNVVIA